MATTEPPALIDDTKNNVKYKKRQFLGKGGFAKCWCFEHAGTKKKYAGKCVAKASLKPKSLEKIKQEVVIHSKLNHQHVVGFVSYFASSDYIYIILEYCSRHTLMELHKRRRKITEPECRYFMLQIADGVKYLHDNNVVHRDLKLANLFLNENLQIKIGDFGLASTVDPNIKRETLCGTPNYIAPEILTKTGHSFEVDIWSFGCIIYTLLVGKPPFETKVLKETYNLIRTNTYTVPHFVSPNATNLIKMMLNSDPAKRPPIHEISKHTFFDDFTPDSLPISCLDTAPRFDQMNAIAGRNLNDNQLSKPVTSTSQDDQSNKYEMFIEYGTTLIECILNVSRNKKIEDDIILNESEDPDSFPIYWVTRWVDYSDKYGLGYELCDNSGGVLFNDKTRLLVTCDNRNLQYIDAKCAEGLFVVDNYPDSLEKKVNLLYSFRSYMNKHLFKTGEFAPRRDSDSMARLPYLVQWSRNNVAIVLFLSNGTVQINFFSDHMKLVLCPLMKAVTVINSAQEFRTFRLSQLATNGITKSLIERLEYATSLIQGLKDSFNEWATG